MISPVELICGVALPALLAIVLTAIAQRPWRRGAASLSSGAWAGPLVLGVSYIVAHLTIAGMPNWPPSERWQWLVVLVGAATLIGLIDGMLPRTRRWLTAALVTGSLLWTLRPLPSIEHGWAIRAAVALGAAGLWAAMEPLAARGSSRWMAMMLAVSSLAASVAALLAGQKMLAHLAGAPAVALLVIAVMCILGLRVSLARGAVAVFAPLHVMILTVAWMYMPAEAGIPWFVFVLVGTAPVAAWGTSMLRAPRNTGASAGQ